MSLKDVNDYAFVNARVRGLLSRFLRLDTYEGLLQSKTYEDFMKLLATTYYGPIVSKSYQLMQPTPDELAHVLSEDFAHVSYSLTKTLSGKVRDFAMAYMDMFLAESIKSIVRGIHVGLDKEEILRFAVPTSPAQEEEFEGLAEARSVVALIEQLPHWELQVALLTKVHAYEELDSTAPLEVAIETWYLGNLMKALHGFSLDNKRRVIEVVEARVDLRNVLTMMRALALQLDSRAIDMSLVRFTERSNSLLEGIRVKPNWREVLSHLENTRYRELAGRIARSYEETDNLVTAEIAVEDFIAQQVRHQMIAFPFHLGTVIGFFNLKFYEVRNIRSIAVGVERGESPENIRQMITIW